jgi:hypothetical protein
MLILDHSIPHIQSVVQKGVCLAYLAFRRCSRTSRNDTTIENESCHILCPSLTTLAIHVSRLRRAPCWIGASLHCTRPCDASPSNEIVLQPTDWMWGGRIECNLFQKNHWWIRFNFQSASILNQQHLVYNFKHDADILGLGALGSTHWTRHGSSERVSYVGDSRLWRSWNPSCCRSVYWLTCAVRSVVRSWHRKMCGQRWHRDTWAHVGHCASQHLPCTQAASLTSTGGFKL